MTKARTIREEQSVESVIDDCIARCPRVEELWEGWKWRLSRGPTKDATAIDEERGIWMIKTPSDNSHYGLPTIAILYRITATEVDILAIKCNDSN